MNSDGKQKHELTDEQFCELLMQGGSSTAEKDEAASLREALSTYRAETLQWAERRSATHPSLVPAARRGERWAAAPQWALSAVAVLTVAIGVVHYNSRPAATAVEASNPALVTETAANGTAPDQIEEDNALLHSIDSALNTGSGLPVDALGLTHEHDSRRAE